MLPFTDGKHYKLSDAIKNVDAYDWRFLHTHVRLMETWQTQACTK